MSDLSPSPTESFPLLPLGYFLSLEGPDSTATPSLQQPYQVLVDASLMGCGFTAPALSSAPSTGAGAASKDVPLSSSSSSSRATSSTTNTGRAAESLDLLRRKVASSSAPRSKGKSRR